MIFYISFETVGKKALRFKNALKMYRYGLLNPPNVQPHFSSEWEDFLHTFIPLSLSLLLSYLTYTHAHTLFFDAHSSTFIPSLTHTNTHSHTHTHTHLFFVPLFCQNWSQKIRWKRVLSLFWTTRASRKFGEAKFPTRHFYLFNFCSTFIHLLIRYSQTCIQRPTNVGTTK